MKEFLLRTVDQHGYTLYNYREVIEPQVESLISIHGESAALQLINTTGSQVCASLYQTIRSAQTIVQNLELNPEHEDDYYNAGGFFGRWETYTDEEKLEIISQALSDCNEIAPLQRTKAKVL